MSIGARIVIVKVRLYAFRWLFIITVTDGLLHFEGVFISEPVLTDVHAGAHDCDKQPTNAETPLQGMLRSAHHSA